MSRSYRKPYTAFVSHKPLSMRQYKRIRAQQERARVRNAIKSGLYDLAASELAPWDAWECPLDGQKQYHPENEKAYRK